MSASGLLSFCGSIPVLAGLIVVAPTARADAPDILAGRGVQITGYGLWEPDDKPAVAHFAPGSVEGVLRSYGGSRLVLETSEVCAHLHTRIGIFFRLEPSVAQTWWDVTVWGDHPELVTTDGRHETRAEWEWWAGRNESMAGLSMDKPYQVLPGLWTLSLVHDGEVVARKSFHVSVHCDAPIS